MLAVMLAAVLAAAAPQGTLFTNDGGRVRGTLVEAGPAGVTVLLPDGSTRRYAPSDVRKVVLADGSLWRPGDPPPQAPREEAAAPAPLPPVAAPAPLPPAAAAPAPLAEVPAPPAAEPQLPAVVAAPVPAVAEPSPAAPAAGVPAAASAPIPASPMRIPVERLDSVYLISGGRVRAFVTEESADGVVVRMVDGTERRYPAAQVAQIAYTDGTVSVPGAPRK